MGDEVKIKIEIETDEKRFDSYKDEINVKSFIKKVLKGIRDSNWEEAEFDIGYGKDAWGKSKIIGHVKVTR